MKTPKRIYKYAQENLTEVLHTTINPEGPGVVRLHMVPPALAEDEVGDGVVIVNGQDIIPIGTSWMILLAEMIKEVNKYAGREIKDSEYESIIDNICRNMRHVYPFVGKKRFRQDIARIMKTFKQVAYGEPVDEYIEYISIGDYAPYMQAPHRMDLMVSAMTKEGRWHCNQQCVHCYAAGQQMADEEELSTQDWITILDKCRASGIPMVTFTGGEPTMREDLIELIDHARWFVTRLNTNGIKLTPEYCRQLFDASLDSCQITFYSYDEDIHNRLVGATQYENTVAGIKNALAAGINISINTPLCTLNRDYVKTLEFLHGLGVTYVTCSGLITTGKAVNPESTGLQLSETEIEECLTEAVKYCFTNQMEISFTSPGWLPAEFFRSWNLSTPNCGACLSNMAITPAGNVVPCQSFLSDGALGNMLTDSWEDIWNSDKCKQRREYSAAMLGKCPLRVNG